MTCDFIPRLHVWLSDRYESHTCKRGMKSQVIPVWESYRYHVNTPYKMLVDENYACATRSSLPRDRFTPKRVASRVYMIPVRDFVPERKSRSGTATGMNSFRYESYRYDILERYHVNEYRATRGNRDELIPVWKSYRYHVNTPLAACSSCAREDFNRLRTLLL